MLQIYFGAFANGRLKRMPFLGYALLLGVLLFAFMFGTIVAIVGAEKAVGGNLADAQALITKTLAIPYMIILAIVMIALIIAGLNITAKRARDIGLPGWVFTIGFVIISVLVSEFVSDNLSQTISSIVGFGLLLTPSDVFKGNQQ